MNPALATDEIPLSMRGPAPPLVVVGYGFWLFLLSDIIMFAVFFAAYAVLSGDTAGGPTGRALFARGNVLLETGCLLASSYSCGLMGIAARNGARSATYLWAGVTLLLGGTFLVLELAEFAGMIAEGAGPGRSAFLSAFFALVGLHGAHVTMGIAWLAVMIAQVATLGFTPPVQRRLFCFGLFWHALDIVWVGVFTIVYLGAG